ncbi:MAG: YdcF family protein [Clostridia bacterium]|nr:YdcF family protein [Clostridia bacterium]
MKKLLKTTVITILSLITVFFLFLIYANVHVLKTGEKYIKNSYDVPESEYLLVFGASVQGNEVSFTLSQRLNKAIELYNNKKCEKIIVSGDHSTNDYNEVKAMKDYLVNSGIDENKIIMDHLGIDTFNSVEGLKENVNLNNAIFVTHEQHLKRALYYAEKLGINAYGVSCDNYSGENLKQQNKREFLARVKAFILCEIMDNDINKLNKLTKKIEYEIIY